MSQVLSRMYRLEIESEDEDDIPDLKPIPEEDF